MSMCLQVSLKPQDLWLFFDHKSHHFILVTVITVRLSVFFCLWSQWHLWWHRPAAAPVVCWPRPGQVLRPYEPQLGQLVQSHDPAGPLHLHLPGAQWYGAGWGWRRAARAGGGGAHRRGGEHCGWADNCCQGKSVRQSVSMQAVHLGQEAAAYMVYFRLFVSAFSFMHKLVLQLYL